MLEETSLNQGNPSLDWSKQHKIAKLHKMLDNQLTSVGEIFNSGETFNEIEDKLRQLQVKLGTLKKQGEVISQQPPVILQRKKQYSLDESRYSYLLGRKYWDSSNRPTRISEQKNLCSIKKTTTKNFSGKKLNFEEQYIANKKSCKKRGKSVQKIKSEGNLFSNKVLRTVSPKNINQKEKKRDRSSSKKKGIALSHFNTEKKEKKDKIKSFDNTASSKKFNRNHKDKENFATENKMTSSSKKFLSKTKTQKILKREGSSVKNAEKDSKNNSSFLKKPSQKAISMEKRIYQFEKKKLAQQLDVFKRKNEVLEKRVQALKGFQDEFMKLKSVFDKGKLKTRNK